MFYVIRLKGVGNLAAWICFLLAAFIVFRTLSVFRVMQTAELFAEEPILVIDAGHGGFDGGAVAVNGTRESDINLAISLKLDALAGFMGRSVVLTRTDDSRRTDLLSYSEHEDLVYRADLVNKVPNPILFSIHQNFYPTTQPYGAQVLYANDERSTLLGRLVQSNLVSYLQPENRRLAEPAPRSLYLTSHVNCPAILVECGFLSNYNEMEKLMTDTYQTALAAVLMASYLQYLPQHDHI